MTEYYFDIETLGTDPQQDKILAIQYRKLEGGEPVDDLITLKEWESSEGEIVKEILDKQILFPPRMFCEDCFTPTNEWVHVKDTGMIQTYSISYLDTDARRIKDPVYVRVLSVDGASELQGMMHYFGEVSEKTIKIGMKVKAKLKPKKERSGSILDIENFRPF